MSQCNRNPLATSKQMHLTLVDWRRRERSQSFSVADKQLVAGSFSIHQAEWQEAGVLIILLW
jgi:hypothetical protein